MSAYSEVDSFSFRSATVADVGKVMEYFASFALTLKVIWRVSSDASGSAMARARY